MSGDTVKCQLFAQHCWAHDKNNKLDLEVLWPKLVRVCTGLLPADAKVYVFGSISVDLLPQHNKRIEDGDLIDLSPLKEEDFEPAEESSKKKASKPSKGKRSTSNPYRDLHDQLQFDVKAGKGNEGIQHMKLDFRPRKGPEKAVDVAIAMEGSRIPENSKVYVFSGDGDLVPMYQDLADKKSHATVCSWSWNLSPAVEGLLDNGTIHKVIYLNKYLFHVTKFLPDHRFIYLQCKETEKNDQMKTGCKYFEEKAIVDALHKLQGMFPSSFYLHRHNSGDLEIRFFCNESFKDDSVKEYDPAWKLREKTKRWLLDELKFEETMIYEGESSHQPADQDGNSTTNSMSTLEQPEEEKIFQDGGALYLPNYKSS